MEFNIQKFLVDNKLTKRSLLENLEEDDNTGAMLKTDAEQDEMSDDEEFGDEEPADDWHKAEPDDSDEFEKEPTAKDISKEKVPNGSGLVGMELKLKALENQKDALLNQLRSNIISIDQYKSAIGTIPAQIKKLRADIDKAKTVSLDDEEPEL